MTLADLSTAACVLFQTRRSKRGQRQINFAQSKQSKGPATNSKRGQRQINFAQKQEGQIDFANFPRKREKGVSDKLISRGSKSVKRGQRQVNFAQKQEGQIDFANSPIHARPQAKPPQTAHE
jgi:hypothetical protein